MDENLYRWTRSWPEWWRRRKFGDAVVDAEQEAEAAEDENARLRAEVARLRAQLASRKDATDD